VKALSESAVVNLVSHDGFNMCHINLSQCVNTSGEVLLSLSPSCEFLMELNLSHCPKISDSDIRIISKRFKMLELVDFSHCFKVTDASLDFFGKLPFLKTLHLQGCDLSDHGLAEHFLSKAAEEEVDGEAGAGGAEEEGSSRFQNLSVINVKYVRRVTFDVIFNMEKTKKFSSILHSSLPCYMYQEGVKEADAHNLVSWNSQDAFMFRSNAVIPKILDFFYFEVHVISGGEEDAIGIGIAPSGHSLKGMPGWNMYSYGWHSDDGAVFSGDYKGQGRAWGPKWAAGDTVGLGLVRKEGGLKIFFTKNGEIIEWAFRNVIEETYYCVAGGLGHGAKAKVIFDRAQFLIDEKDLHSFINPESDVVFETTKGM
jgi:hypothetical protein